MLVSHRLGVISTLQIDDRAVTTALDPAHQIGALG